MRNANESLTVNLGNRRVRGKADAAPAAAPGADVDLAATGRARRAEAVNARRAPDAPANTAPQTQTQKVARVAELLRTGLDGSPANGDDADELEAADDAAGGDGAEAPTKTTPRTMETLAEALGVEVDEVYETVVALGGDESMTLGELKDLAKEHRDIDAQRLEFTTRKSGEENELMRRRQELDLFVKMLGGDRVITPELKARATAERTRIIELERARTVQAIPEWKNAATEKTERAAINAFLEPYGYGPAHLENVVDHRQLKVLRDFWQLRGNVDKALAKVTEDRGQGAGKPARSSGGAPRRERAPKLPPNASREQKVAAVAHLLRNGI